MLQCFVPCAVTRRVRNDQKHNEVHGACAAAAGGHGGRGEGRREWEEDAGDGLSACECGNSMPWTSVPPPQHQLTSEHIRHTSGVPPPPFSPHPTPPYLPPPPPQPRSAAACKVAGRPIKIRRPGQGGLAPRSLMWISMASARRLDASTRRLDSTPLPASIPSHPFIVSGAAETVPTAVRV